MFCWLFDPAPVNYDCYGIENRVTLGSRYGKKLRLISNCVHWYLRSENAPSSAMNTMSDPKIPFFYNSVNFYAVSILIKLPVTAFRKHSNGFLAE